MKVFNSMARKDELEKLFDLMKRRFRPERTAGWDSTVLLVFSDLGAATADVESRALTLRPGRAGKPLATVRTSSTVFKRVLRGKIPLDIAIVKRELETDDAVEAFKFISVFEPDAVAAKQAGCGARHAMPLTDAAFLKVLCAAVSADAALAAAARGSGVEGRFSVGVAGSGVSVVFHAGRKVFSAEVSANTKKPDMSADAATLEKVLTGAQNMMINLNRKNLDGLLAEGADTAMFDLLIYLLPGMSRIYRGLLRAVGPDTE